MGCQNHCSSCNEIGCESRLVPFDATWFNLYQKEKQKYTDLVAKLHEIFQSGLEIQDERDAILEYLETK